MVYGILIIFILFGIYRYDFKGLQRGRLFYYCLLLVFFICVAGFRYRLGIDSVTYEYFYKSKDLHTFGDFRWSDFKSIRYMPGFIVLASICKTISPDFTLLQIAVSLILNLVVFRFFWYNTRHIFLAILLYLWFQYITLNMEVLREALSVSFFLLAWPYFRDGKWLWYYLLALCAFLCHISAFIMFLIPLCWLPGVRWFFTFGKQTFFISLFILVIAVAVSVVLFRIMESLAVTESMMERTQAYATNDLGSGKVNIGGIISNIFRYALYPFIAMYFLKKSSPQLMASKENEKKQLMCILGIYLVLLSTGIFILTRYNNYLIFFSFCFVSDWAFSILRERKKKIRLNIVTWSVILCPLFMYQFYSAYLLDVNKSGTLKAYMKYYPYADRFQKDLDPDREKTFKYYKRYK